MCCPRARQCRMFSRVTSFLAHVTGYMFSLVVCVHWPNSVVLSTFLQKQINHLGVHPAFTRIIWPNYSTNSSVSTSSRNGRILNQWPKMNYGAIMEQVVSLEDSKSLKTRVEVEFSLM